MFKSLSRGGIAAGATAAVAITALAVAGGYGYAATAQVDYALPLPADALDRDSYGAPHHDYPSADLPVPTGTEAYASVAGEAEVFSDGSCGNGVQITAEDGAIYVYCHFDSHATESGAVSPGDLLGYTGSTGNSSGPHLHYQVRFEDQLRCPQNQLLAIYDGEAPPAPGDLPTEGCTSRIADGEHPAPMGLS